MIVDLLAIIFIVILSLIFCKNNNNNNSCFLSHIVIGMAVIVFYKLFKYITINNLNNTVKNKIHYNNNDVNTNTNNTIITENFVDTTSINDFISNTLISDTIPSGDKLQTISNAELANYVEKITQLTNMLNNIKNEQSAPQSNVSISPDNIQKLDLESQQQYQMFQIDYLNKQLLQAKDIINANTIAASSNNYKPIKVYSSCVISNTDGTTTVDQPVITSAYVKNNFTNQITTQTPVSQMMNTISQTTPLYNTKTQTQPINNLNLDKTTGIFNPLLNKLFNNNTILSIK